MVTARLPSFLFSQQVGSNVHLSERALGAFGVLVELLKRGQAEGVLRKRPLGGQAAASWAQVHGITMLAVEGLLIPEKMGANPVEGALSALFRGTLRLTLEVRGSIPRLHQETKSPAA